MTPEWNQPLLQCGARHLVVEFPTGFAGSRSATGQLHIFAAIQSRKSTFGVSAAHDHQVNKPILSRMEQGVFSRKPTAQIADNELPAAIAP